jgi:hypothetical protein
MAIWVRVRTLAKYLVYRTRITFFIVGDIYQHYLALRSSHRQRRNHKGAGQPLPRSLKGCGPKGR